MKTTSPAWIRALAIAFAAFFSAAIARADTVWFLMSGPADPPSTAAREAYVVGVSDPALIEQARLHLAAGGPLLLIPRARVAAGPDGINRNYAVPGRPAWNWHAAELLAWTLHDPSLARAAVYIPNVDGPPSSVPQLLQGDASHPAVDTITLVRYPLVMELNPDEQGGLVNISTRGWVDGGERLLIAGFVVQGRAPRNVLVRALGPSLAQLGVDEALDNPRIAVFHQGREIAANDDWGQGNFVPPVQIPELPPPPFAWLYPTDAREAAVQILLPPGVYSLHVSGAGTAGVALADVHDLDALAPR